MTNATGEINTVKNIEVIKKPKKIKEEAIYYGEKEIKYVFKKNEKSNFLTVGFSGIPKVGTPPRYNYMRTIMDIEVNQLFILDDHGMIGCYYLGENKDFAVERSIAGLIDKIAQENEIPKENIITIGSSKGGYASLYYGIKYNYGHVISASPQTKLGSYLIRQNIANAYIAQYISGGVREQNKVFLDDLLYEIVKESEVFPDIRIHCGIGEMHYTEHVIPLQRALMDKGVRIEVDLENYSNHNDVLKYYPEYLRKTLFGIIEQLNDNKEREV